MDDWYVWVPIIAGKATLADMKTVLTLDDVADLHDVINLEMAIAALPDRKA